MAEQRGADKWKLKKWFSVYAPKSFNEVVIAEIPAKDEKAVIGRHIKVGLDYITHNPKNAYMNLFFKVTEANGDKASTQLVRMELLFSYIRSLVRRYRSIASSNVKVVSKDKVSMVIKPVVITSQRDTHARIRGIREEMNSFLENYFSENDSEAVIKAIVDGKLQEEMYSKLSHIAPLSKVEIRKLEIVS